MTKVSLQPSQSPMNAELPSGSFLAVVGAIKGVGEQRYIVTYPFEGTFDWREEDPRKGITVTVKGSWQGTRLPKQHEHVVVSQVMCTRPGNGYRSMLAYLAEEHDARQDQPVDSRKEKR